jgi:hypothetical protein
MTDATYNLNGGFKPTLKRFADLGGPDFFPTPRWATVRWWIARRSKVKYGSRPAVMASMARVLASKGNDVIASDLYDRGFGETGIDFLKFSNFGCTPWGTMSKPRERQIILKTDQCNILLRNGRDGNLLQSQTVATRTEPSRRRCCWSCSTQRSVGANPHFGRTAPGTASGPALFSDRGVTV